jgi:6-phosphogluconolactonase (cycloisomerase 2 family)
MSRSHRPILARAVFCALLLAAGTLFAQAGFLYVLNDVDGGPNLLYGYRVNEADGSLTALPGFPMTTGGNGSQNLMSQRVCFDASHARLYVVNGGSNTLSAYTVNMDNGALTPLPFSPLTLPAGPAQPVKRWAWSAVAVHPAGSPLVIVRDQLDIAVQPGQLASFVITATTVTPAAGNPFYAGDYVFPYALAYSRDGRYVYAGGNRNTPLFGGYQVDEATGALTALPGSPFQSDGAWPLAYAVDIQNRLMLYSYQDESIGQSEVYTFSSGVPTAVSASPFASGLDDGIFGIIHPAGFYIVADRVGSRVGVFQISGTGADTTLTAVPGSPFVSGGWAPTALALNTAGTFLYAANTGDRNITTFAVNLTTGTLSIAHNQPQYTIGGSGYITGMAYTTPYQPLLGDLNLDGRVDAIDADLLARLLADSLIESEIPAPWNGDMDADGMLNVLDLALLELLISP